MANHPTVKTSIPNSSSISRVQLENGITLLVYENPAVRSVNIVGSIHAGSIYESADKSGLASFAALALMTGAAGRSFDEIHSALEDIGAELNIRGHIHKIGLFGKALSEDLPQLLDTANDALRHPTFPEAHIERLRGERLTRLQYSSFDTRYRAAKAMRETLYPTSHPYHYSAYGAEETTAAISRGDLMRYQAAHFGPRGMILVIVGAVKAAEVIQQVGERFGDWQNPDQPAVAAAAAPDELSGSRRQFVFVPGKTQSDIKMGAVGPSRYAADYLPAQLANSVLGEFGMMGRIGKNVREQKGLAYYAFSHLGGGHGPDPWEISAGVNPDNVELAVESITAEVERLISETVSDDDIADNQSYFAGRLPLRLESNEGIASHIHAMESYRLGLDYLADYKAMIYRITKEDMLAAAQNYLKPAKMVVAVAGPESSNHPLPPSS